MKLRKGQEQCESTIHRDQRIVIDAPEGLTKPPHRHSHNLVDHDLRWLLQSIFSARRKENAQ